MAIVLLTVGLLALCAVAVASVYAQRRQRARLHEALDLMTQAHDAFKKRFEEVIDTIQQDALLEEQQAHDTDATPQSRIDSAYETLEAEQSEHAIVLFEGSGRAQHFSDHAAFVKRLIRDSTVLIFACHGALPSGWPHLATHLLSDAVWTNYASGRTLSTTHRQASLVTVKAWLNNVEPADWTAEYEILNTSIANRRPWTEEITSSTG